MRYAQRYDGEGFEVKSGEVTRWACCDCGLVHDIAFVAEGLDEIGVAASRNARATAARRRGDVSDGYAKAFYEIAEMLGIGARAQSPAEVWEKEMKPELYRRLLRP